jgi:CubicO group peptidase (beta-lactamase class C family)
VRWTASLLGLALTFCSSTPVRAPFDAARVDAEVRRLMQRENVQGLAIAFIDGGKVMHVAAYGHRNVERGLPLTTDTVMYGASLTKTAFAYMLLQLVDEKRLDLDASVATLLPRPLPEYDDYTDLASDERWKQLTPRILLTHTSGLANFRWLEPDNKLRFHFAPGTRYGYSGEGFYILQTIVEEGLGLDTGREMQRRIFDRFGMANTSMQWRPAFAANLADGYDANGKMVPHDERSHPSAAGSMDTTITDQARLWAAIVNGEGLSAAARREMLRAQAPITSRHQFPSLMTEQDERNRDISLAAGLGLIMFRGPQGKAWFKGGHNDSTGNMVLCVERSRRCAVMLANDVRAEHLFPEIAQLLLGDTGVPWRWEYDWYEGR